MNSTESSVTNLEDADSVRAKITALYQQHKPSLDAYHAYAQSIVALSERYHALRLRDEFQSLVTPRILVCTLDARQSPVSLDRKLAELRDSGVQIRQVIYDQNAQTYYLFT